MDTTSTLSPELMSYYERTFLDRAIPKLVMKEGLQTEQLGSNNGKTVTFTRFAERALATTPLSEGTNPTHTGYSETNVVATLAEYGDLAKISKFASLTLIDKRNAEKIEVMGSGMGSTLDALARDAMFSGFTVQMAAGRANNGALQAGDIISPTEVAKVRRTLIGNNVMLYDDNMLMAKIQPFTEFDIITSTGWVNVKIYSDAQDLYNGEIGSLYTFRFLLSTQHKIETNGGAGANLNVYANFFHGKNAAANVDLEGDMPGLVINTGPDSNNPANRFSTIAWAGSYVAKVLNANWGITYKCLATQ